MVGGIFIPIFKKGGSTVKVRVIYNYYDRELGFEKKVGDELEVSDERGQILIAAEVAEEIIEEEKEESSEEQEEKPKRTTRAKK